MEDKSFIKKMDFLGCELSLYYQNSKRIQTNLGGIVSGVTAVIFFLLIIGFGQDFFNRKNPSFVKSNISLESTPMFLVNNNNFSIAFRLEQFDLSTYHKPEMFELSVSYTYYSVNNNTGLLDSHHDYIPLRACDKADLLDSFKLSLDGLLCPQLDNILIGGSSSEGSFGLLEVYATVCIEGEMSSNGLPCATKEETEIELNSNYIYFTYYLMKATINPEDYFEGIKTTLVKNYFTLNSNARKYSDVHFRETIMNTDYGWLVKDVESKAILGLSSINTQIDFISNQLTDKFSYLGAFGINFQNDLEKYYREYPKAQNLAAQVGGILKIFLELGYFVVGTYNLNFCQLSFADYLLNNEDANTKSIVLKEFNKKMSFISKSKLSNIGMNEYNQQSDVVRNEISKLDEKNYECKKLFANYAFQHKENKDLNKLNEFYKNNDMSINLNQSVNESKIKYKANTYNKYSLQGNLFINKNQYAHDTKLDCTKENNFKVS